jgi:hypothetical protein
MDTDLDGGAAAIRTLLAERAITAVLYRFARAVDRKDIELLASVYHDGATDDHGAFSGSAEEFVRWVRKGWATGVLVGSNHVVTNVMIDFDRSGEVASVESYFLAHHSWRGADGDLDDFLGGRYLDRFELRDGEWRIAARRCVWDWGRTMPVTEDAWFRRVRGTYTWGTSGPDDPSYRQR